MWPYKKLLGGEKVILSTSCHCIQLGPVPLLDTVWSFVTVSVYLTTMITIEGHRYILELKVYVMANCSNFPVTADRRQMHIGRERNRLRGKVPAQTFYDFLRLFLCL